MVDRAARAVTGRSMFNKGGRNSNLFTPGLGRQTHTKEVEVNVEQVRGLQNLFETHPTLVAAKSVLEAQLLSSGLTLKRDGEAVELTPECQQHVDTHWIRFAKDVISGFLVMGFVVVSYENEAPECATTRRRFRKPDQPRRSSNGYDNLASDDPEPSDGSKSTGLSMRKEATLPIVVPYGACRVTYEMGGRANYQRIYRVYRTGSDDALRTDEDAVLHLRSEPDENGTRFFTRIPCIPTPRQHKVGGSDAPVPTRRQRELADGGGRAGQCVCRWPGRHGRRRRDHPRPTGAHHPDEEGRWPERHCAR